MGSLHFDQQALRARLERLRPKARADFALRCAERLLPLYQRFHVETGQGDPDVLNEALYAARAHLGSGTGCPPEIGSLADRCEALVPVEDESWTDLSGLAQNAAAAMAYALRSVASGSAEDAVWAAVQGVESADLIASTQLDVDFNEPGIEERIVAQEVVQRELAEQEASLEALEDRECP